MKKIFILTLLVGFILGSCGSENKNSSANDSSSAASDNSGSLSKEEMQGPAVELKLVSFDVENNKHVFTFYNRTDKAIKNIRGYVIPLDSAGAQLTSATGRSLASNFSKAQNPEIVGANSKVEITFGNKFKGAVADMKAEIEQYETTDGEKVKLETSVEM